jgi:hypothetical protein
MSKRLLLAIGVFCTSLSVLTLEITVTRIASVVMYYHFSFLAVSLALLGSSIGGIYVFLGMSRFRTENLGKYIFVVCLLQSVTTLIALAALLSVRLSLQVSMAWLLSGAGILFLFVILLLIVPFFFAGVVLALVLRFYSTEVSWLYFADLGGAGLGCLLIVLVFDWIGGINAVFFASLLPILAALVFAQFTNNRRFLYASAGVALALIVLGGINSATQFVRIRFPKGETETTPIFEKWNAYSRVAVYPPNLLSKNFEQWDAGKNIPVDRLGIDIDAGAWTSIVHFDGDFSKLEYLKTDIAAVPYRLTPKQNVLIIGSGGAQDVLIASLFGVRQITAVEMNPIMFTIVNDRFGDFSGRPYQRANVRAVVDEARSFIRHSPTRYDIIQATLVDTFAASAAGAFALSENNLYTREAFGDYWDHLNDDGILAMTRWYFDPPVETFRVASLTLALLKDQRIPNPEKHIVITRQDMRATFLLKKSEFTESEVRTLQRAADDNGGFEIVYNPLSPSGTELDQLFANPNQFIQNYPQNISAPTDDQPFFFYFVKPGSNPFATVLSMFQGENEPSTLLAILFVLLFGLALLLIFVPLGIWARSSTSSHWGDLIYFAGLGIGFILIEITLIQRFILFLGHPVYALAVILFALLFFGGIGSSISGFITELARTSLHKVLIGILLVMLMLYNAVFPWFINNFIQLDTNARIVLTIVVLAPLGILMGMPFPLGVKRASAQDPKLIPWLWGVNGAFSVVGSVLAAILAINFGLGATFLIGTVAYAIALIAILRPVGLAH